MPRTGGGYSESELYAKLRTLNDEVDELQDKLYAEMWRKRYLEARVKYLEGKMK